MAPPPGLPAARHFPMITAAQCRSARTLLGWPLARLAAAALVAETAIDDFEGERRDPDRATVNAIERAFAAVGVAFSPDGDVRLLTPGETAG
ncbi:MAG: hypothetical protein WA184_00585 [Stellaceae bacterium]|jgi:transcriptional regulator with XRE-family HTH domain